MANTRRTTKSSTSSRLPEPLVAHWVWQIEAACRDMESSTFFHPHGERDEARERRIAAAKAICESCPVRIECLEHSVRVREPYGVWGGLSEAERAILLGVPSMRYPGTSRTSPHLREDLANDER